MAGSTAPSLVTWEGGVPGPLSPGAPRLRGGRSAAGGLEAAGCRDLKWCPCRAVGAGELGPAGEEPASRPAGCWSASGPGQDSGWRLDPGPRLAITRVWRERPLGGSEPGRAARRAEVDEGDQVRAGTDLAVELRITQGPPPLVSPLPSRHSPLPESPGPRGAAPQILKGLASPRPCLEFLAGESEKSTTRLSLPFSFFLTHFLSPTRNPGLTFRASSWQMAGT